MNSFKELPKKFNHELPRQPGEMLAVVGPTGSGKTSVAIDIALATNAEILCADSRTIFRGMDIGTAKPTEDEQKGVIHHGLDLVNPDERYSAADFVAYAKSVMVSVWSKGKPLIIVGGSGMYIDALLFNYSFRNEVVDSSQIMNLDDDELLTRAQELYPNELLQYDVKNTRRLRELLLRGPVNASDREFIKYSVKMQGIEPDSTNYQIRIRKRVKEMLKQGFVQEVILVKNTFGSNCPGLNSPGYAEVLDYVDNGGSVDMLENAIVRSHMRLVKKQMTWFRKNPNIEWYSDMSQLQKDGISYLSGLAGTIDT